MSSLNKMPSSMMGISSRVSCGHLQSFQCCHDVFGTTLLVVYVISSGSMRESTLPRGCLVLSTAGGETRCSENSKGAEQSSLNNDISNPHRYITLVWTEIKCFSRESASCKT